MKLLLLPKQSNYYRSAFFCNLITTLNEQTSEIELKITILKNQNKNITQTLSICYKFISKYIYYSFKRPTTKYPIKF